MERQEKTEKQIAESISKISEHWKGLISPNPCVGGEEEEEQTRIMVKKKKN
jgi:hypothetical protein